MNESRRGDLNRNGSSVSSEDCVILTTIESDDDLPNPLDAGDFLAWEEELLRFLAPLYLWRPAKVHLGLLPDRCSCVIVRTWMQTGQLIPGAG